jgi:hypothetical protein
MVWDREEGEAVCSPSGLPRLFVSREAAQQEATRLTREQGQINDWRTA